MHPFLTETEFAAKTLISLAADETNQLSALNARLDSARQEYDALRWDSATSELHVDFSDAYHLGAWHRAEGAGNKLRNLTAQFANLNASVDIRKHSISVIAGAIFQLAKQSISRQYSNRTSAPPGRTVGSLPVRDIIWQTRNQSMHYEDSKPNKPVRVLFATLAREHGQHLSLDEHPQQNLASQVLTLLGWNSYDAYLRDMQLLLPSN